MLNAASAAAAGTADPCGERFDLSFDLEAGGVHLKLASMLH